jgi:hypothetical protein
LFDVVDSEIGDRMDYCPDEWKKPIEAAADWYAETKKRKESDG